MTYPCMRELETEIGLKPDGDRIAFCEYRDGYGWWDLIISIDFDRGGDWYISQIDVETMDRRGAKVRQKLEGKVFEAARDHLCDAERRLLEDHVYECVGDVKPLWAA